MAGSSLYIVFCFMRSNAHVCMINIAWCIYWELEAQWDGGWGLARRGVQRKVVFANHRARFAAVESGILVRLLLPVLRAARLYYPWLGYKFYATYVAI